ncbi:MAG: ABC transporter permease subunit [Planctomycetes bacterium]|nr:ABC transporter permease subunit [Planctomycetota bacterium]
MKRWRSGWLRWAAVLFVTTGLLAPFLANDVPLVARIGGTWRFPAVADCFGVPTAGPGDLSWKQWWSRLSPDGDDFAWMPPWPYGPQETDPERRAAPPSWSHPLGNDDTGRDVLARIVHGAGTAVRIGGAAVLLAGAVGTLLGLLAGRRRGVVDFLVLRLLEVFLCFPSLLFVLFATAFFGTSSGALVLVLASLLWTGFTRVVRGELLSLRERDFVLVARGLGVGEWRLVLRHLLPQLRSQIGVTAAFAFAAAVIAESTLTFLGLGPQAPSSWGAMLQQGKQMAPLGAWHLWLFPALAIVLVVGGCHTIADRLRNRPA